MYITTFDQLGIAKFCPKQEIIDVITKSKESKELWINGCINQHGMNIALWKGVVDYFKIEIIHFMIDTSHKFAVNNTDIKIQEGVLFVIACVSNHQPHDCLLNRPFRPRSKKTSKIHVTGLCGGNSLVTGEFHTQRVSNAENVSIWWRDHASWSQQRFSNPYS